MLFSQENTIIFHYCWYFRNNTKSNTKSHPFIFYFFSSNRFFGPFFEHLFLFSSYFSLEASSQKWLAHLCLTTSKKAPYQCLARKLFIWGKLRKDMHGLNLSVLWEIFVSLKFVPKLSNYLYPSYWIIHNKEFDCKNSSVTFWSVLTFGGISIIRYLYLCAKSTQLYHSTFLIFQNIPHS